MHLYYWKLAVAFRFLLIIIPQNGYIHPDEFFQSSEITAGDIFNFQVHRPWEFNNTFPIRCIVFPYLTTGIPFLILNMLTLHKNPLLLLLIPRFIMFCLSILQDLSLYKICKMFKRNHVYSLFVFSTSYVTLVFYTRTFSNSIESVLFSLLLLIISKMIYNLSKTHNNKDSKENLYTKEISYNNSIGMLLALGFYNRPTFILFAFVPILFWLQLGLNTKFWNCIIMYRRLLIMMPSFIIVCFLLTLIDTIYYSKFSVSYLINHSEDAITLFENLIFTPINFISYNLDNSNLAVHGIHPRFLHMLINVPLLFGILGIIGIFYYIQILLKIVRGFWPYDLMPHNAMMLMSFIFPLLTLSLFPHQEPRFLIPLLLPLCFICSNSICGYTSKKQWLFIAWIFSNIFSGIFFGYLHQGGLIPSIISLQKILIENNKLGLNSHVIFYHTYMPPRYLLTSTSPDLNHIYDLSGSDPIIFENTLNSILSKNYSNIDLKLYAIMPNTISKKIINSKFVLLKKFYPHFSSEDTPDIFSVFHLKQYNFYFLQQFFDLFSLNFYQIS